MLGVTMLSVKQVIGLLMFPGHQRTAIIRADGLKRLRKEVVMMVVMDGCFSLLLLVLRLHEERWRGRSIRVTVIDAHPVQQLEGKRARQEKKANEKKKGQSSSM